MIFSRWSLSLVLGCFSFFITPGIADGEVSNNTLPPSFDAKTRIGSDAQPSVPQPLQETSLPDVTMGDPNAPLKIVMYHSLACHHCKRFKREIFPLIKEQFIDKGYVYFVFVDFPIDPSALGAVKVAWIYRDVQSYLDISEVITSHDEEWVGKLDWPDQICRIVGKERLVTKAKCHDALDGDTLEKQILQRSYIAQKEYKIEHVPAFIVNGQRFNGDWLLSPSDIKEVLKKMGVLI